jgi:hypothetical protein
MFSEIPGDWYLIRHPAGAGLNIFIFAALFNRTDSFYPDLLGNFYKKIGMHLV